MAKVGKEDEKKICFYFDIKIALTPPPLFSWTPTWHFAKKKCNFLKIASDNLKSGWTPHFLAALSSSRSLVVRWSVGPLVGPLVGPSVMFVKKLPLEYQM